MATRGMDRKVHHARWSPLRWPLSVRVGAAGALAVTSFLVMVSWLATGTVRTLRISRSEVTIARVEHGIFHDLIPLRTTVVPRETVYIDAVDGGRVDRVLVEAGDMVQEGQPLLELSNTNLVLQVIQQESQLNQAISQLQQNEIALEQNQLANERDLANIDYNLVRLGRAAQRRVRLASQGSVSNEERDVASDELSYYQRLRPIQAASGQRQTALRDHLLPDIQQQLKNLRGDLAVVHDKLDSLIVRAPVAGKVTALDLKIGEMRSPGQRLAEVTPDTGMELVADIDEFYLPRVRVGQAATVDLAGKSVTVTVRRVLPQVNDGQFRVDLTFATAGPSSLIEGATARGRLQLGEDQPANILATGPFLERTGGNWVFVVAPDGRSAQRRRIEVGRRTSDQIEILNGLSPGDRVITSDYAGWDRVERINLEN
ncbi:MAG TPA: HlyD family efflux transporter periplasmic adaptor subunit [Steroidobacteraceae bacterium]